MQHFLLSILFIHGIAECNYIDSFIKYISKRQGTNCPRRRIFDYIRISVGQPEKWAANWFCIQEIKHWGERGGCETPGCRGIGHIKGAKYTSHHRYGVFRKNCGFLLQEFSVLCHLSIASTGLLLVSENGQPIREDLKQRYLGEGWSACIGLGKRKIFLITL